MNLRRHAPTVSLLVEHRRALGLFAVLRGQLRLGRKDLAVIGDLAVSCTDPFSTLLQHKRS